MATDEVKEMTCLVQFFFPVEGQFRIEKKYLTSVICTQLQRRVKTKIRVEKI